MVGHPKPSRFSPFAPLATYKSCNSFPYRNSFLSFFKLSPPACAVPLWHFLSEAFPSFLFSPSLFSTFPRHCTSIHGVWSFHWSSHIIMAQAMVILDSSLCIPQQIVSTQSPLSTVSLSAVPVTCGQAWPQKQMNLILPYGEKVNST